VGAGAKAIVAVEHEVAVDPPEFRQEYLGENAIVACALAQPAGEALEKSAGRDTVAASLEDQHAGRMDLLLVDAEK